MRLIVVFGILATAAPAVAADPSAPDPAVAEAQRLFQNGARLYAEGSYPESVVAFQSAYDLTGEPLMLFNMANAYERMGELRKAIDLLSRFRPFADPAEQDVLLQRIVAMERRLGPPLPEPIVLTPEPPRPAPWLVAATGALVGLGGATVSAVTWSQGQAALSHGDEAGWNQLRPVNNGAGVVGIVGGVTAVVGLTWGLAR